MSSLLPPPPKMSGLTTPSSSSSGATSTNRFHAPSISSGPSSKYKPPPTSSSSSSSLSPSSSSLNFLSTSYENFAPRSSDQRARLARIASLTAGPYHSPSPAGDDETQPSSPIALPSAMCPPKPPSLDPLSILHRRHPSNNNHNYNHDDAPPAILAATLLQTHRTAAALATLLRSAAALRLALRASLNIADDLSRRHADLLRHSGELSAAAERLQHEEAVLTRRAEEIGRPLKHYDDVDGIGALVGVSWREGGRVAVRGAGRMDVDEEEEFLGVLAGVDEAMEFFGRGAEQGQRQRLRQWREYDANASGSAEYFRRACVLQDAALELLRVAVADRISVTSTQIQDALNLPKVPLKADKLEASLVYTRFHGISKRTNKLIVMVRRRLDALGDESVAAVGYEDLLTLCRNTYCGAREVLLTSTVRNHMEVLKERHGLVGMTRLASVFLIRLCTVETALYLDFFGDPDKRRHPRKKVKGTLQSNEEEDDGEGNKSEEDGNQEAAVAQQQQQQNSNNNKNKNNNNNKLPAASTLASQILSEDSTYRDAEFQSMLGGLCSSLHKTIRRGLVSILDLDVLCQVVSVLREERSVANKSPTTIAAARAVSGVIQDAQERLIFCANTALHKEVVRFKPTPADLNYPGKLLGDKPKAAIVIDDGKKDSTESFTEKQKEESKYPSATTDSNDAVAAQLRVYESWFPPMRSVLRILSKIFRVVEPRVFEDIALQSVQSCTKSLKEGSVYILRASGQIHADLFLVKHLLILREQLSPFDIQLRSVERQLDFSEAGKAVSRFLANRNRRLFSMSTENALVTLLREGVSVQESSVDSKRDLEDCLRSACNDFIEHTSSSLLGPIAIFVDQCKNAVGSGSGSTDVLIKAPFMNAVLVKGVFTKAFENLDGELENVSKQMNLYLENGATQSILMKPVVRKLSRSLDEARRFVGEVPDGANNWEEGAKEEVLKISETFEAKVKSATSKHGSR